MQLNQKISFHRKRLGLTQIELAEKVGVSRQAVSRWELGTAIPDINNLVRLGELFSVSSDYLLGTEKQTDTVNPAETDVDSPSVRNIRIKLKPKWIPIMGVGVVVILLLVVFAMNDMVATMMAAVSAILLVFLVGLFLVVLCSFILKK